VQGCWWFVVVRGVVGGYIEGYELVESPTMLRLIIGVEVDEGRGVGGFYSRFPPLLLAPRHSPLFYSLF